MRRMVLLGLCACAIGCLQRKPASAPDFPRTVAVLPFANDTTSAGSSDVIRAKLEKEMRKWGWEVVPAEVVDAMLRERGISGSAISSTTCVELRDALGTDAVASGRVVEFRKNPVFGYAVAAETVLVDLRKAKIVSYDVARHDETLEGGGLCRPVDPLRESQWTFVAHSIASTQPLAGGLPARRWVRSVPLLQSTSTPILGQGVFRLAPADCTLDEKVAARPGPSGRVVVRTRAGLRSVAVGDRVRVETVDGAVHSGRIREATPERLVVRTSGGEVHIAALDLADVRTD